MKSKLLLQLIMLSKNAIYGVLLQALLFNFIWAADSNAQEVKSVNNVEVNLDLKNASLIDVFRKIESQTNFVFSYINEELNRSYRITGKYKRTTLSHVLLEISRDANLKFKQVNNNINVTALGEKVPAKEIEVIIQTRTISGKVTSMDDNEGLPGVNVVEKGTTNGTVTDVQGDYSLEVSEGATLVFSSVGYTQEEVEIGDQPIINLAMSPDVQELQELVVIGYGEMKKSDLTGAVSAVDAQQLAERQTASVSEALQGSMPGVMVTRNNNEPGSSATIRVRGITTIGQNNPLIILDGVPVNNIDDINPDDIESISVLKDAASASIYGSRAASGVIVVKTKRAKSGEVSLSYNMEFGFDKATNLPQFVDAVRYMEINNEQVWNDNDNLGSEFPVWEQNVVENYASLHSQDPDEYPNTDWYDWILNDRAPRQSHSLSFSAGTEALKSRASIVYDKFQGLYDANQFQRITARINNDITITKNLSASIDMSYKRSISDDASYNDIWTQLHTQAPVYAAVWSDGRIASGKQGGNVYGMVKYGGDQYQKDNLIRGRASLEFTPIEGLKLSGVIAPGFSFNKSKRFIKVVDYYDADDPTLLLGQLSHTGSTNLTDRRNEDQNYTLQFLANYDKNFGNHHFNILAGYEYFYAFFERLTASRDNYTLTSFPYLNLGPQELRDNGGQAWENAYRSYFGRINYDFNNKYLLQVNLRYDGSSRFHEDYRWGLFPSFSAGWVISEESFMNPVESVLSFLKLRGSWGSLGNERIGNYPYQSTISFGNALLYQGNQVASAQTAAQTALAIEDISWETTETINFGLDAGFFDDKLSISGDYFVKKTKDMLLALEVPDYIGFGNPDQNTGTMDTKGWEFEASWNDNIGDLRYSVSFNLSDFRSEMGDLGGTEFLGDQIKIEGSEFNEWYGYISDGIFQTQEDVDNSPRLNNNISPGDLKYVDISGPEGTPDGIISPEYDRTLLGGSLPRFMYGGLIRLNYKNFDLGLTIQGVGKQNARLTDWMVMPLRNNWGNVPALIDGRYWSLYNTDAKNLAAEYPRISLTTQDNNRALSNFWLFNGAYLRFKNINIGYTIPSSFTETIGISNVRAYFTLNDFLTFSNYPAGWDPEAPEAQYPITTSAIFGLSVNF